MYKRERGKRKEEGREMRGERERELSPGAKELEETSEVVTEGKGYI